jgi:hypothetical protein
MRLLRYAGLAALLGFLVPLETSSGVLALSGLCGLCGLSGSAQRSGSPQLQRRPNGGAGADAERDPDAPVMLPGPSDLPDAASGAYALGASGEVIELDLEGTPRQRRLQGYLSRVGAGETDKGTPLTYFFAYSSVAPGQITFTTRKVHGRWWSFVGDIVRGTAQAPSQRGYYLLSGSLTEHLTMEQLEQRHVVTLPSLPRNGAAGAAEH